MRLATCFCFFLAAAAISLAQSTDTNFPTGPQYLVNPSSPFLHQSIATPTLSLLTPGATTPNAPAEEQSGTPDTPAFGEFQNQSQIDRVYWGVNPNGTAAPMPAGNPVSPETTQSSTEIESASMSTGIFNAGVTRIASPDSLREHGYGVSLGDVAAYWKAHKQPVARVYTNADIARLHGE